MTEETVKFTRPDWDTWFMRIAHVVAQRGSCRRLRVGAILVDGDRRIISTGYNGAPISMPDCLKHGCDLRTIDGKESCVRTLHAESNAIDYARWPASDIEMFTTVIPCRNCALRIIQAGIVRVTYDQMYISQGTKETEQLLRTARIELRRKIVESMSISEG